MNIRGTISWRAGSVAGGSVEFAFRPTLSVTRTEPVTTIAPPTKIAETVPAE